MSLHSRYEVSSASYLIKLFPQSNGWLNRLKSIFSRHDVVCIVRSKYDRIIATSHDSINGPQLQIFI